MAETRFCARCGAVLPVGAQFCPTCGAPASAAAAAPPAAASVRPPRSTYLIWVPLALIAIALLAWAVLAGLPFSREPRQPAERELEVVTEGGTPTTTVSRIGEADDAAPPPLQPTAPPATQQQAPTVEEISEAEALRALEGYIVGRRDYGIARNCLEIRSLGYRNAGYGFEARDRCEGASLGRWRVDSEDPSGIFLQRADGRYLRP